MQFAPLALLAGVLSITSPCCLPLIPGYLSYISGVAVGTQDRKKVMGSAALFVLGFGAVFTALGVTGSLLGRALTAHLDLFLKISGFFVLVMGVAMLGLLNIPFLMKEKRLDMRKVNPGMAGAMPLGMAFAFGWTPCIGPILATIIAAAAATRTVWKGAALLAIYSAGMGTTFLLMAYVYSRAGGTFRFLKKHALGIERTGGGLMVAMGALLITGYWTRLFSPLTTLLAKVGWPPL